MEIDMKKPNQKENESLADRINKLAWASNSQEHLKLKTMFGQARRRAKEKPVSLPKLSWMQDA